MAIWQFSFHIIPKDKALKFSSVDTTSASFEEIISWEGYDIKDSSIEQLSKALKANKSWSNSNRLLGDYENTNVELFYDDCILDEVSIRLDLRNITLDSLNAIIEFIEVNDAAIITSDGQILDLNIKSILKVIKNSKEYSFILASEHFLANIRENED